ncbi:MAG: outer membrane lipoprotein-sorting protein [Bdellovibrio sp. CG12_big_fil_rev_8_21_14_0_65_39_13]|nr:MAG: outer membrane lipoprotein-sorting protein [Bdellovibrio sp. CG22_combo_CG10-13_8_21_14_all_39_27]PIQ58122.1 MAG: outer membrane lipoprotein-sorting protein [Bdellovibrio sp. CG12_big_fil_rev_8_21_14_0_65_39_13]PIR34284.1 MAG: outer membrane lipoprotein-sorting protein [Bdellovibrio sp. CG11_big_fil_rev_8_21_14_0_20_39_38]PJB52249.1 MAG: outer membrane lipoprotein-sorting protein [Bdellovibrio sp. CG_4_9_14_3_um_filter_39_7]
MKVVFLVFIFLSNGVHAKTNLLEDIDKKLQPDSYESYRKLINIEPDGTKKEFVLYMLKKGKDKVASLFMSPASDKGRATLRLVDNMWLYIPGVAKPLRISSMQSVTGGVFNNADIMRLDFSEEYQIEKQTEDKTYYFLELKAKNETVTYEKLKMKVEKSSLFPIEIDCIANGITLKTIRYLDPKDFGDFKRPSVLETTSQLQKGFKSVMIFAKMKKREFKDEVFTMEYMGKLGDIRQ